MALKLELAADDVALFSGGAVLMVDDIDGVEVDITVAISGEITFQQTLTMGDEFDISDQIHSRVMGIRLGNDNNSVANIGFTAPRSIKISRFHNHQSDDKLKYVLDKFTAEDNIDGIKKSLEVLLYE